ncbi:hypothetical protein HYPSUDRAFT_102681, partial [Hypholoma sublateritium FD-334 SS-4]
SIEAPKNAPFWVVNALNLFQSANLGTEWSSLVVAWLKFEQDSHFIAKGRLGTHCRPRAIADWIQRARSASYQPEINNLAAFSTDFSAWWQSLQPDWRANNVDNALPRSREDWDDIRRPGINGLLSVAAALFFWGYAARNKGAPARSAWLDALNDVIHVLNQLA